MTSRRLALSRPATFTVADRGPATGPILVTADALPWDVEVEVNWFGDVLSFAPGSITVPDDEANRVKFLLDHRMKPFGYATAIADAGDRLVATMAIPRDELEDPEIAAAVRQMRNGVRDAVSVGVDLVEYSEEPLDPSQRFGPLRIRVTAAELLELSSAVIPRFADARITRIAAAHPPTTSTAAGGLGRSSTMPRTLTATDTPADDVDDDLVEDQADDVDEESERLENHRRTAGRRRPAGRHTRDQFGSIGRFARAVAAGDTDAARRYGFALTDVTTGDVPGILPPQWVTDFAEELAAARPLVTAFETRPLPESGMVITYPVKTAAGPLTGEQAAEKTDITSGKLSIDPATAGVETWAGGNDVSIQTILRTDPDYLDLLFAEYGYDLADRHNTSVGAKVLAAIGAGNEVPLARDVATIVATLATAARRIWAARRGARPNRLVLGLDVWEFLAGAADPDGRPLFPAMSGANPAGQITITTDTGEVRGLDYLVDPTLPAAKAVMGWNRAVTTWLGPVATMSADVPSKLGRDVAMYQFAASAVRRPDALVELTLAPAAVAASKR